MHTFANSAAELTATVTIVDNDSQRLMFKTTDFNHTEYTDGTHFDVVVQVLPSLNSQSATTPENADNDITFDIILEGGNATKGSDYTNPTQTSYTISSVIQKQQSPSQLAMIVIVKVMKPLN